MKLERTISFIMIAFSAFFLLMSFMIENRNNALITPGTWPAALMITMLVLSIILLLRTFRNNNIQNKLNSESEQIEVEDEEQLIYPKKLIWLIVILAVYTILLGYIGFIFDTIIAIFLLTLLFGMKKWLTGLLTGIFSTAGAIILFPILLSLPFPRGIGLFHSISLLFY